MNSSGTDDMDNNTVIVLKLFLDRLGFSDDDQKVSISNKRRLIQKSVYLGQLSGFHLGYDFGWYVFGPYCPRLDTDLNMLSSYLYAGDNPWKDRSLLDSAIEKLENILPFLSPYDEDLDQEQWVDLLSCWHFLRTRSRYGPEESVIILTSIKPEYRPYIVRAERDIQEIRQLVGKDYD